MYKITFILKNGESKTFEAKEGDNILEIAHRNRVDLEGACEGALACSTCHVIVDESWFQKLGEATEDEEDMLDYAFGLTATSRLGCQIKMCAKLNGIIVRLPQATRNVQLESLQSS